MTTIEKTLDILLTPVVWFIGATILSIPVVLLTLLLFVFIKG